MRKAYIKLLSTQQSKTSREQNDVHFHGTLSQAWEKNVHWTPSHGWLNYKTDEGLQSSPSTGATCYKYLFAVLIARDQLHLMTIRFDYLVQLCSMLWVVKVVEAVIHLVIRVICYLIHKCCF